MKKLFFILFGIIFCALSLTINAFASEPLYKSNNKILYIGYTSLSDITTLNGMKIGGEVMLTDNLSIGGEGNFLNETAMINTMLTIKMTTITGFVGYHTSFIDMLGGYAKIGYGTSAITISGVNASSSGNGITLDIGAEYKFSPNLIGHIGYKSFSMDYNRGATVTTATNTGITGGVGFLF